MSATAEQLPPSNPAAAPHGQQRIGRVFQAQQATALALRHTTLPARLAKLEKLRQAILDHQAQIVAAAAADFGRSATEAEFTEVLPVIMEIAEHRKHLKKWLRPRRPRTPLMMLGTRSRVQLEPRGRCLIIAPWNYPITLTPGPVDTNWVVAAGSHFGLQLGGATEFSGSK